MTDEPRPWDRLPSESRRAYAAFCVYRDLGPDRKICDAVRIHYAGKACRSIVDEWAKAHGWDERTRAYDVHMQRIREAAAEEAAKAEAARLEAERQEARQERIRTGRLAISKAREALEATPVGEIPLGTVPQLIKVGSDLCRLEDGEATAKIEGQADLVVKVLRGASMDDL